MSDNTSELVSKIKQEMLSNEGILVKSRTGIYVSNEKYFEVLEMLQSYQEMVSNADMVHKIVASFIIAFDEVLRGRIAIEIDEEKKRLARVHAKVLNIMYGLLS